MRARVLVDGAERECELTVLKRLSKGSKCLTSEFPSSFNQETVEDLLICNIFLLTDQCIDGGEAE